MSDTCTTCGRTVQRHCARGCGRCTSGFVCPRHGKDWAYRTGGGFLTAGATGTGARCRRCGTRTVNCRPCRGRKGRTCRACGGTGQTCPSHGRFWG